MVCKLINWIMWSRIDTTVRLFDQIVTNMQIPYRHRISCPYVHISDSQTRQCFLQLGQYIICLLMVFSFLKTLKCQIFLQKLNMDYDCSILFSNFMAGDSVICNGYMSVWFVLGHGVKCCNLIAAVTNFNTCISRWHKLKYDDGDEDFSLQGHEAVYSCRSTLMFQRIYPNDGGSRFLWNVSVLLPDYMASHPHFTITAMRTVDLRWWKIFRYLANKEQ